MADSAADQRMRTLIHTHRMALTHFVQQFHPRPRSQHQRYCPGHTDSGLATPASDTGRRGGKRSLAVYRRASARGRLIPSAENSARQ